eukprot:4275505-Prymnesium_polylepis.1
MLQVVEKGEAGLAGAISQSLERVVYVEGDFVIREGEVNGSMHFVERGMVDVLQLSVSDQPLTTLGPLSFFGEMALLSRRERAIASVTRGKAWDLIEGSASLAWPCRSLNAIFVCRSRTNCETYNLSRTAYERLVINFPSFKDWVESVARLRLALKKKGGGVPNKKDLEQDTQVSAQSLHP